MRHKTLVLLVMLLCISFARAGESIAPVKVIHPTKMAVSEPLRDIAQPVPTSLLGKHASTTSGPLGPTLIDWAGLSIHENPTHVHPGNPSIAVGPNDDFVQMVNAVFYIASKTNVHKVPPSLNSSFWTGFGGACEFSNDGDPTVLYDPLADRWVFSQHVFGQSECIAVSQTSDPTGAYYLYEFATPGNDNPQMGVWSDAYYVGMKNLGSGEYDVYSFERDEMLAGNPSPQAVTFSLETLLPGADNFLPADLDGVTPPPAGAPGIFMGIEDPSTLQDHLVLFELDVDWNNTANSTLSGPTNIPVSQFDANLCNFNPNCIRQPNTSQRLDALSDKLMPRLVYRNFGSHQAMVVSHAVDAGDFPDHAGIRWYEFRNTGSGWSVHQENTYVPDTDHRWNSSIAMNGNGDIMMGYTVSSGIQVPTIRYAGRQAGDPLGEMSFFEGILAQSVASQVGESDWGEHSSTVVDPADDFSFWHTNYWVEGFNDDWHTWIGKFQPTTDPPNIVITMTPQNPPVVIPSGGGAFTYDLTVTNVGGSGGQITFDVWNRIFTPEGNPVGPTIGPVRPTFSAGQVFTKTGIVQNIPAGAPPGSYSISFNAGRFAANPQSANIIATDSFPFTKSAGPVTAKSGGESEIAGDWSSSWSGENGGAEVIAEADAVPLQFELEQNYPNPFNPSTVIRYQLSKDTHVRLAIYNTRGEEVATLVNEFQGAGSQNVVWKGINGDGRQVAAGVYVYRLEAGNVVKTKKMIFAK